ncbi:MAG: AAA family ATPase [Gammaproteobacteria bacterium]
MNCAACHHPLPGGARFCPNCGTACAAHCTNCNTELPPAARFCASCGTPVTAAPPQAPAVPARVPRDYTPPHLAEKILQTRSALEGERKQVTVLFADVKGSMELAGQLDPETWHGILDRFFAILAEGVHRFEGTVNQYTGDGIMALFGAPIAHEDHAQRACYAALHLRERLGEYADELRISPGVNFSFRLGMNSGEVVVGRIGDNLRMDYTAQGQTVGLAQRMEQLAPADGIALSEHTRRAVDGYFALRALGAVPIKGLDAPVGVHVLEAPGRYRSRLDTSRARGLSRFVGRDEEMEALDVALQRALDGTGRVAAVVGEAGVGKSRLCAEFVERCRGQGLTVYEAHCPAHGKTIPYLPLLELLRNLFGITEQDGLREARQKIAGELALLDDDFADDRALVLDFLGVADPNTPSLQLEPAVRQQRLFTFLRRLVHLRSQSTPLVLLIDDLHWIDPGSDQFVTQIVEAVSTTRTLLLVNFRPEYTADWLRKSWVLQLPMAPLGPDELTALVQDWVGSHASVADLPVLIGTRSGGNPFFAEEIVLSLLETGALAGTRGAYQLVTALESLQVPPTVQALLAARIDRLGEREKQVLYTAAVIGREFPRPLLETVLPDLGDAFDGALANLLAAELVHERALYPVAEYAFKHPLTHEVALHAQLGAARRARHAAIAQAIAAAVAARPDEQAGLLAHHYEQAGESLVAATWHVRAARWVQRTDLAASYRHWNQARALVEPLTGNADATRLLLEVYPELLSTLDRLGTEAPRSEALYHTAIALAQSAEDRSAESLIEAAYAWLMTGQADWRAVESHAKRAITLADAEAVQAIQLHARYTLARGLLWQVRLHDCAAVLDEVLAIGGSDDAIHVEILGHRPYLESLTLRGNVAFQLGSPAHFDAFFKRLSELLRRIGSHWDASYVLSDRAWLYWGLGDAQQAETTSLESLRIAERFGANNNVVFALLGRGLANYLAERWIEADEFFARARQLIADSGTGREWDILMDGYQAVCKAGLGQPAEALRLAERGTERARANGLDIALMTNGRERARVLRMLGEADLAAELEAQIEEALEIIRRTDAQLWLPFILLERAGLARLRGDPQAMAQDLAEARRLLAAMGVTGWEAYARSIEA